MKKQRLQDTLRIKKPRQRMSQIQKRKQLAQLAQTIMLKFYSQLETAADKSWRKPELLAALAAVRRHMAPCEKRFQNISRQVRVKRIKKKHRYGYMDSVVYSYLKYLDRQNEDQLKLALASEQKRLKRELQERVQAESNIASLAEEIRLLEWEIVQEKADSDEINAKQKRLSAKRAKLHYWRSQRNYLSKNLKKLDEQQKELDNWAKNRQTLLQWWRRETDPYRRKAWLIALYVLSNNPIFEYSLMETTRRVVRVIYW